MKIKIRKTIVKPHTRTLPSGKKTKVKGHTRTVKSPGKKIPRKYKIVNWPPIYQEKLKKANELGISLEELYRIETGKEPIFRNKETYEFLVWSGQLPVENYSGFTLVQTNQMDEDKINLARRKGISLYDLFEEQTNRNAISRNKETIEYQLWIGKMGYTVFP